MRKTTKQYQEQKPTKKSNFSENLPKEMYVGDPKLLNRVEQYVKQHPNPINVDIMAENLQEAHGEYRRKKKLPFQRSVQKAYDIVTAKPVKRYQDGLCRLEEQHLMKKMRREGNMSESNDSENSEKSFSSSNEDYVMYKDSNTMNSFMQGLYNKTSKTSEETLGIHNTPTRTIKNTQNDNQVQTVSSPKLPSNSTPTVTPSPMFLIDRNGTNPVNNSKTLKDSDIIIDLENEDTITSTVSKNDCKTDTPDTSGLKKQSNRQSKKQDPVGKSKKGPKITTSNVKFCDVGGNDHTLMEVCKLLVHLKHPEVYQQLGVPSPCGFLLHGPPGCGKTLLAHAIAGELELPFLKLASTEIVSGVSGESEEKLRDVFEQASSNAPCILFLDEIDAITQKRENASKEMERRIVSQLLTCMDELNSSSKGQVLVIGATNRPDSIDPALRRAGRFDREISLGIPDEAARIRILKVLCRDLKLASDFDFTFLARNSPGFVGADLMALTREAAIIAINRIFKEFEMKNAVDLPNNGSLASVTVPCTSSIEADPQYNDALLVEEQNESRSSSELKSVLTWLKDTPPLTTEQLENLAINIEDFKDALKHVQPSAKREGFATIPDVSWEDIGALHDVREELQMAILAPVKHREQYKLLGLSSPPGILLAGPPGCGKTLLAKAVANESGINFISVKGPELLNMYVGESERAVRTVFQRARNSSPCVIFFDELDALCPRRSHSGEGGASVRVVNQLLTEMDGLEERKQVFIMAATNRPDIIDPAILRPGRLDKLLYVGLPDAKDRLDILRTITKNGSRPKLAEGVSLEEVSKDPRCEGFTGADLSALVREAAVAVLREVIPLAKTPLPSQSLEVEWKHFELAMCKVKPSVSSKSQLQYKHLQQ